MDFEKTLMDLYDRESEHNPKAYENIPAILKKAEELYEKEKEKLEPEKDIGQSLRSTKGSSFEKLMVHILSKMIDEAGLPFKLIRGATLTGEQTDMVLETVKRNILVHFGTLGTQGYFMPDADIIVYHPADASVKAIISCKISLRERIAQTGYWKLKLRASSYTRHIKAFFLTPDRDKRMIRDRIDKSKAIVIHELDAAYVLRKNLVEQYNFRKLERIKEDLQGL